MYAPAHEYMKKGETIPSWVPSPPSNAVPILNKYRDGDGDNITVDAKALPKAEKKAAAKPAAKPAAAF